jgi:hypothetical protein
MADVPEFSGSVTATQPAKPDATLLPETVVTAKRDPPATVTTLPETVVTAKRDPPVTASTPYVNPPFEPFAGVRCSIEVYPFEGGENKWTIQDGQILACTVNKPHGSSGGTFNLTLAPGGPNGVEGSPTWSEIITPMSLVLIGMQRGKNAAIIMIGVVRSVGESQMWLTSGDGSASSVRRGQTIHGEDFSYYFLSQNYSAMSVYGFTSGTVMGAALGVPPELGFPAGFSPGMVGGTSDTPSNPSLVARSWFDLMMGPKGLMGQSFVPYWPSGFRLLVRDILKRIWEEYPAQIPMWASFLAYEGSWMAKFQDILPWPWYEFMVTTAPIGAYEETLDKSVVVPQTGFVMTSMPEAGPASPVLVARINPIPVLNGTATVAGGKITLGTIDVKRWSKLPVYELAGAGFASSSINFSINDVRNAYFINPTSMTPGFGGSNANFSPAPFLFTMFGDPASIKRYGYRPEIRTTQWWFDQLGMFAQDPALGFAQGVADCLLMVIAQYHPTPLMARGSVTIPLRPDILPGNVFRYLPFKSADTWDFYVEGVQHSFMFGGRSTTTLSLARGLPSSVYADTTEGGLLESIWTGNAQRADGIYKVGLPKDTGPGLTVIESTSASISSFLGGIGEAYVAPQQ